jgi:hypothetical protein
MTPHGPNPKNFLPRPYAIGPHITHKENVRPMAQAIGLALNQDEQYGGIKPVLPQGPEGRPNIARRLAIKAPRTAMPHIPRITFGPRIKI